MSTEHARPTSTVGYIIGNKISLRTICLEKLGSGHGARKSYVAWKDSYNSSKTVCRDV